jgi:predicted dehydrogenase
MKRREFIEKSAVLGSVLAVGSLPVVGSAKAVSKNDKIRLGIMGLGGRGTLLAGVLANRQDVDIIYLCDVNARKLGRVAEEVHSKQNTWPKMIQDFREMLDDQSLDGIVNATPVHWHALSTIMACQAGKDVYVEKPLSLTLWEGRQMIKAARKYDRIVQTGIQYRSAPEFNEAVDYLRSGILGDIHMVRVFEMLKQSPMPKKSEEAVPNGLNWDMWCGPSKKAPYSPGRWWFNRWEYSSGGILGDQAHQLDIARGLIDRVSPKTVYHAGGIHHFNDGRDIPDTQIISYDFGNKLTMLVESALWTPYMKKTPMTIRDSDAFPEWPFNSTKIELCGTEGFMYFGRHGGGWQVYNNDNELIKSVYGRQTTGEHLDNWLQCIRTREKPAGDVEEAHYSLIPGHLGNISYRAGNKLLEFDPRTESTNDPVANKFLTKDYRAPWIVPENV